MAEVLRYTAIIERCETGCGAYVPDLPEPASIAASVEVAA